MSVYILVVDDEPDVEALFRQQFRRDLRSGRFTMEFAPSAPAALARAAGIDDPSLILILSDINMPGMSGLEMLPKVRAERPDVPVIMITAYGDVAMAVTAMKAGAFDFLQKPVRPNELLNSIKDALDYSGRRPEPSGEKKIASAKIESLTSRQREILEMVLAGSPSKTIAHNLQISQRTVDNHRAAIMRKIGAKSLSALIRVALAAS